MQRILRAFLVCVLAFMMSFNPAAAWHHWGGGQRGGWCHSQAYYGSSCSYGPGYGYGSYGSDRMVYHDSNCGGCSSCGYNSYGDSDACHGCGGDCGGDCGSNGVVSDCGSCGGCSDCGSSSGCSSCGHESSDSVIIESTPYVEHEVAPEAPAESVPSTDTPQAMPQPRYAPPATVNKPMETTPAPTLPPEPAPMPTEPTDDLFGTPPSDTTAPAEEAPTTPPPAATEAPAEESNDLFGPSTEEPATPPATEAPAETPAETPAESATDDLFGTEPTPPAESATPAETPAAEEAGSDLFGDPDDAGDAPATESAPAEGESTPAGETEDLFGPSAEATPAEDVTPASNDEPAADEPAAEEASPFGATDLILREAGGLASMELRQWVDNSGRYSCNGRLVNILDGQARLMKDNGHTTTVPLYRLSATDLAFLHRQASAAQPHETFAQAVSGEAAESLSAN